MGQQKPENLIPFEDHNFLLNSRIVTGFKIWKIILLGLIFRKAQVPRYKCLHVKVLKNNGDHDQIKDLITSWL